MNRDDDDDDDDDYSEPESEELTPVIEHSPDPNRYDDDDIELV
jgi:hypothetical protein